MFYFFQICPHLEQSMIRLLNVTYIIYNHVYIFNTSYARLLQIAYIILVGIQINHVHWMYVEHKIRK